MLGGPLGFQLSRWLYRCMYGCMYKCRFLVSIKGKPLLLYWERNYSIFVKLGMWVVGAQVLPTWSVVTECAYLIPHLHICSDWLITKKSNIQSFVWATLMKLGMWVVMGTSTTYVICHHRICIFDTLFAYLIWLANNKKVKYPEFCMGHSDETWYAGSGGYKNNPCVPVITKCAYLITHLHICYKKANLQSTSWHSPKGGPLCIFCEYSEPQAKNREILVYLKFWLKETCEEQR